MYFDYDPKNDRGLLLWGRLMLTLILSALVYVWVRTYLEYDEYQVYLFLTFTTLICYHRFAKTESGICSVCKNEITFYENVIEKYGSNNEE